MTQQFQLERNRRKILLREEVRIAQNLRGKNQYGWRKLDDRNTLDFDFEYFMTWHINGMRVHDKMWCDGANVHKLTKVSLNYFKLKGELWLLPEDEDSPKYSLSESWDNCEFHGYVLLEPKFDGIKNYDFHIYGNNMQIRCRRKI